MLEDENILMGIRLMAQAYNLGPDNLIHFLLQKMLIKNGEMNSGI